MSGGREEREQVLIAGSATVLSRVDAPLDATCVETGGEVLAAARSIRPVLIALGAELESPDVLTVLEQLRRDERTWATPAVVLTPEARPELEARALELGASDVIALSAPDAVVRARLQRLIREGRERIALSQLAQTDGLTGLANFRAMRTRLSQEFKRARRYGYALTLVMIDLDHLKRLNDGLGHEIGNRAIVALARHLDDNLREVDFAARFGGDEFVALLPYQHPHEAEVFASRLRTGLAELRVPGGDHDVGLTVSIGIAAHTPQAPLPSEDALLEAADRALYEAKRAGRDRVVVAGVGTGGSRHAE